MILPVRFWLRVLALVVLASARTAAADSSAAPAAPAITANPSLPWWQYFNPRNLPFIPIPEVGTDPNGGTTVGLLPVFLHKNDKDEISQIGAPDVTYNPYLGYGGHLRWFSYPSADEQWYGVVELNERLERGADLSYGDGLTRQTQWSRSVELLYDRTATYRFFGIGNKTPMSAQTNYTDEQVLANATLGWNLSHAVQLGLMLRPRFTEIEPGAIASLPYIRQDFPLLPGTGMPEHEVFTRVFVSYDTRDSSALPTMGTQIVGSFGDANRSFLSSTSYTVVGFDARNYQRISDRVVIAAHAALRYMPQATDLPFWDMSSLGGDRSIVGEEQPLRGYGEGRFVDRNLSSAGVEVRTRVLDLNLFATRISLEIAPFIDTGKVFRSAAESPVSELHTIGGLGFRAIAAPFIVGYVDVGYGSEGAAVFSGINYPF
jgi:hypothetical protein